MEDMHTELILRRMTLVCIAITAGISGAAIIGWVLNWLFLARISPAYIPMAPGSALSFVILSFALFVYARKPEHPQAMIFAKAGAFLVLLVCFIILIDFFTGAGLNIEKLLYFQPEKFDAVSIGRMSPITAANFLLSACALLLMLASPPGRHRAKNIAACLAAFVVSVGLVVVLGYLYGAPSLYGGTIIPVALTTAVSFVFMGVGITAAAGQDYWPTSLLAGSSVRARLLRAFLPVTITLILIQGCLDIIIFPLVRIHVLTSLLMAILSVILFGIIISKIAQVIGGDIDRANAERKRAEEEIRETKARLQLQFDRMPIGCIVWDTDFKVVSWNPAAENIFGFTLNEALGKHPYDIIVPKEVQPQVNIIWQRLLEGDETAHSINENNTKDGRTILCEWHNTPLRDVENRIIGALSMVQDITERKQAEEALKKSETSLKKAQAQGKIGNWEFDLKTQKINWSDEVYVLYERDKKLGPPSVEEEAQYYPPEVAEKLHELARLATETGKEYRYDLTARLPSGRITLFTTSINPVKDEKGNVIQLWGTVQDITERKRAEDEIRKLNAELEQRVRDRTAELEKKNAELERMNRLFVGRELRMMELKKKIAELEKEIGDIKKFGGG
ncbi:MAG: PAS domain S-box protein [Candidatus Methanoperedens sp.]|nr:PAS domain S-box protein [Candidatus Methanoperedens sp.]